MGARFGILEQPELRSYGAVGDDYCQIEETDMKKLIVCGALAAFALGTQAASAAEFYIVRDATTKKCTVVDTKPTTTTTTVVGDGVYKTKTEAESAVKTTKVCTEQ